MAITTFARRRSLRAGTALSALLLIQSGLFAAPAMAQGAGTQPESEEPQNQDQSTAGAPQAGTEAPAVPVSNANEGSSNEEIVVTGTLFRRTNTETPSPVTVLSSETLARRGLTNVTDAVRSISADNSGSIPNGFTNGFGAGGSAPALRGLTVNSTLTIIDGLRMVAYPLSDDGQRAFVDLNTIPRVAIERIEVLKDGASSTYGADAIGGVVNVIMRKHFTGVDATVEGGISQRGDGDQKRFTILGGWGDYDATGMNIYAGLEYESNDPIFTKDRGFPFNTADLTSLTGGQDLSYNILTNCGGSCAGSSPVAVVRPATQTDPTNLLTGVAVPGGLFQILNPAECGEENGTILTDAAAGQICQVNQYEQYKLSFQPKSERFGGTVRASVRVGEDHDAYIMGSWYRSSAKIWPLALTNVRSVNPVNTRGLVLPARLTNGQLNPYNPYAAQDQSALLFYRLIGDELPTIRRDSDVIRGAAGISGSLGGGFDYQVDVAAMNSTLKTHTTGNIFLPGLLAAIANGTYNFFDPEATPQDVVDSIVVDNDVTSTANLYLAQAVVTKDLFELPGGPLQIGVGAQARHEALDNPNANPRNELININQVFASGKRNVYAGFFEVNAPVIKQLELQVSGRYDKYSDGFSKFSPKAGFKLTPIPQIALRGTYSKGFRAPSFAESGNAGVIGFTAATPPCIVRIQHGATGDATTCTGGNAYVASQALGFRSAGNPDIKPEKSKSYTFGAVVQPIRQLSFTLDYYNIRKTDLITQGPLANAALTAFYTGQPLPSGYSVVLNPADPDFPNAIRTVAIINTPYVNASSLVTSGLDFSALFQHRFSSNTRFSSQFEATKIIKFNLKPCNDPIAACAVQRYAGTMGPYQLSSGAGTPKYRGSWSNSLEFGPATLTATANYVSGYWNTAEDITPAGTRHDCAAAADLYSADFCKTKSFTWVDLVGSYAFSRSITGYFNVLNLFDAKAPINPPNYAGPAANYNPTWSQAGVVGRFFRLGANIAFHPAPRMAEPEPYVAPPPPPPAPPPATQTCADGSVILATDACPVPPPPPPAPPPPAPERG